MVDFLLGEKAIAGAGFMAQLELELVTVLGNPAVNGIADPGGEKTENAQRAPDAAEEPVNPEDRFGANPKLAVRRTEMFDKHQAVGVLQRLLGAREDVFGRRAGKGRKEEMAVRVALNDVPHGAVAKRAFPIKKNQMLIHWSALLRE